MTHEIPEVEAAQSQAGPPGPGSNRGDYLRHLYDSLHQASRDYDQAIITVAGGTLALSATFAGAVAQAPIAGSRGYLIWAWILLVISVVAIIGSYLTSQSTIRHMIARAHDATPPTPGWRGRATTLLNLTAGAALVAGLALLAVYAVVNINGGEVDAG